MTPGEHYDAADYLVQRTGERLERLTGSAERGLISGDELLDELRLLEAAARVAAVHATLATVAT